MKDHTPLRLGIVTALFVAAGTAGASTIAWKWAQRQWHAAAQQESRSASDAQAKLLEREVRHLAEKAQWATVQALDTQPKAAEQVRFLQDQLLTDTRYTQLQVFRRSLREKGPWRSLFKIKNKEASSPELAFDFEVEEAATLQVAPSDGGKPALTLTVPIHRSDAYGYHEALSLELDMSELSKRFELNTEGYYTFIVDKKGRLFAQSNEQHFDFGEDLSHLPVVRQAREAKHPQVAGSLEYSELPDQPGWFAAWQRLPFAQLTLVTQYPATSATAALEKAGTKALTYGVAIALLCGLLSGVSAAWLARRTIRKLAFLAQQMKTKLESMTQHSSADSTQSNDSQDSRKVA